MQGGLKLPSNPHLQTRLSIKSLKALDGFSYAMYMDDLSYFKGSLEKMMSAQRLVKVPKEIENACKFEPDFYINTEDEE
jgi:hypothetical protein